MANHMAGVNSSNYRQVRLTITQESSGRLSFRIMGKPLNADWKEQHLMAQGTVPYERPILSSEDAMEATLRVIREQFLPGIG